jgi:hypothetical protein
MAASTKAMGIPAAEVGTKWSSMLSNLSSNSKATQETFKELGMDQKQWFAALQESKNTGSNAPVLRFLRELDSRLQKSGNSAKQSLQLFGTEGMMLGGQLGAILPKYDSLLQKSQAAYDANTRLTEEYKRQTDTLNSMLEGIGAKFDAIGVKMGNTMLPVVKDVAYQVDQMMAKLMSGDLSGAFDQAYQALKSYDWVGAGTSIANSIYGGLLSLIAYNQHVFTTIGNDIANYDWRGLGSKISDFVSKGLQDIKTEATRLFNNMSSWVNAGNAQSLGETIGHGLVNAAKSIISAGMDIVGWLKQNVTVANVQTAFAALGSLIDLGIKAGKSFLDGIYKSVKEDTGSYFEGIYTAMVKLKTDIVELGKEIGKAGITWVVTQLDEVIAAIAGKLNPYLEKVNSIFGTNYAMPTSSGFTTYKTDVSGKYQQVKEDAYALGGAIYNVGGQNQSKINNMAFAQDAGIASFMGKPYDYMAYAKQQGIPYDTALANAYKLLTGEDSLNTEYAKKMYGGTTTGNLGTSTGNSLDVFSNLPPGIAQALGMSNVRNTATYPTATNNAATSALASQWTGGTVPVFVTNWGEGGSGTGVNAVAGTNSYGQSVNANGLPVGKFDSAKINTSGPGIGMVANNADFEDAICQVDIFGMTPGLGEALMESGALKPNAHPTPRR